LFDPRASFENIVIHGAKPGELQNISIELEGLARGDYRVRWWDTRTGEVINEEPVVASDQPLRLSAPRFARDVAVKIIPTVRENNAHRR
jgi:hypothetical protein